MKLILSSLLLLFITNYSKAQSDEQVKNEIATVCNYYLEGGTNGDSLTFSKAFYPNGNMMFIRNDSLITVSLRDFMARARNNGQKMNRKTKIEHIEVYGNAALAKLTIELDKVILHDIMQLLKTQDGWKIVNKIFSREEKK